MTSAGLMDRSTAQARVILTIVAHELPGYSRWAGATQPRPPLPLRRSMDRPRGPAQSFASKPGSQSIAGDVQLHPARQSARGNTGKTNWPQAPVARRPGMAARRRKCAIAEARAALPRSCRNRGRARWLTQCFARRPDIQFPWAGRGARGNRDKTCWQPGCLSRILGTSAAQQKLTVPRRTDGKRGHRSRQANGIGGSGWRRHHAARAVRAARRIAHSDTALHQLSGYL